MASLQPTLSLVTRIQRLERIEQEYSRPVPHFITCPELIPGHSYRCLGIRGVGERVERVFRIPAKIESIDTWLIELAKLFCDCWLVQVMPVDLSELGEDPMDDEPAPRAMQQD